MIKGGDVLEMLIPTGGWVIVGDDFNSIRYDQGVTPISKEQFDAGFAQYNAWKIQKETEAANAKTALLNRLGITEDEAKLLLS